jgi:hypothetical protein
LQFLAERAEQEAGDVAFPKGKRKSVFCLLLSLNVYQSFCCKLSLFPSMLNMHRITITGDVISAELMKMVRRNVEN